MNDILREEYNKLNNPDLTSSGRCSVKNNIIQYKLSEPSVRNFKQSLSIDIKDYLNSLITQAEEASIGYDLIKVETINDLLIAFPLNEQLIYIDFFIRQLQKSSFSIETRDFQKLRIKTIIKNLISKKNFKFKNLFLLPIYIPLYNLITLTTTILFIGALIALITMSAPFEFMQWLEFKITYQNFVPNHILNHILNIFSSLVGIETDFKIAPQNSFTAIIFILAKILGFLYVVTFLFTKLGEILKEK